MGAPRVAFSFDRVNAISITKRLAKRVSLDGLVLNCDGNPSAPAGLGERERVKGIEPSYEAWKASVLPLNYTRGAAEE